MKKFALAAAAVGAFVAAVPAQAVVLVLDSTTAAPGGTTFSYSGNFADGEGVQTGSKLVIFDFLGYVTGSVSADGNANVTASTELFSGLPSFGYTDDPTIANLVFTYTGPTADLSGVTFSGLSAVSTFSGVSLDGFSALTFKTSGAASGTVIATQGGVGVPAVPEPATWGMLIGGFGLMGGTMRYRRGKQRAVFA